MIRFFKYLVVLWPVSAVVSVTVPLAVFRSVDLSFTAFAALVVAPLAQAGTLALIDSPPPLGAAARDVWRAPTARIPLLLDGAMLTAGVFGWQLQRIGFLAPVTVQPAWAAIKAAVAALLLAAVAIRRRRSAPLTLVAAAMAGALIAVTPWPVALRDTVAAAAHRVPAVAVRAAVDGSLIAAGIGVLLAGARRIESMAATPAALLRVAAAALVAVGAVDALAAFNTRELLPPWNGAVTLGLSLSASAVLYAAAMLEDQ